MSEKTLAYGSGLCEGFRHLLSKYPDVFVIGQGLWSPWYVGNSMTDLDKEFGKERVIDTPVSEDACTGIAIGASLYGYRPVVIHPRVDFMILATNQIVNQAAKWGHMLGGNEYPAVTIRGIVNRGGQQGAQHSQSLHSWFAHVPGLKVVMPATALDARNLLIASTLYRGPVMFFDDRWLYEVNEPYQPVEEWDLAKEGPKVIAKGSDLTLVGAGYSTQQCLEAAALLKKDDISCDVVDLRVLGPANFQAVLDSVKKTRRLMVVDAAWETCGLSGEVIAWVAERSEVGLLKAPPKRLNTVNSPAPTSAPLEQAYYAPVKAPSIAQAAQKLVRSH